MTRKTLFYNTAILLIVLASVGCGESYDKAAALRMVDRAIQDQQLDQAKKILREVLSHYPDEVEARFKLGLTYGLENDPHRAWIEFTEVHRIDSTRIDAIEQLGMLAYAADEREEAIHFLERAVQQGAEKAFLFDTLAYLHFQEGTVESAKKWMRRAIQLNPRDPRFRYKLARYHHFVGEDAQALPILERLTQEYPTYWDGKLLLGRVYRRLGDEEKALAVLTEAIPQGEKHHDHFYEHGMAFLKTGDARGAIKAFEASILLKPDKAEARYGIGQAYLKLGERENARKALNMFREVERTNEEFTEQQDRFISNWQQGLLKEKEGDTTGAIAAFREALKEKEGDTGTNFLIWMMQRNLGDPIAAARTRSAVEKGMAETSTEFGDMAITLSKRLSARGFNDKAISVLNEALESDPANLSLRHQLIRIYDRVGDPENREREYEILKRQS